MTENIRFMMSLEKEYRQASGLRDRSQYKIFYGQTFPAPILTLGLNPGGTPAGTSEDGMRQSDGTPASSSASYFEAMENDVLDCDWDENVGVRKLLLPLVADNRDRFRREIVKTNVAFRRSAKVSHIDFRNAQNEAEPFIAKIIDWTKPQLVILTGANIDHFLMAHAKTSRHLVNTIKAPGIHHVVFAAAAARLVSLERDTVVVQVDHASQFSWTYERYGVCQKILELMDRKIEHNESLTTPAPSSYIPGFSSIQRNAMEHKKSVSNFSEPSKGNLAELKSKWLRNLPDNSFRRVHHFSSDRFSSRPAGLTEFVAWCEPREIQGENVRTLERGLDVMRRIEGGQDFESAVKNAWVAYPLATR